MLAHLVNWTQLGAGLDGGHAGRCIERHRGHAAQVHSDLVGLHAVPCRRFEADATYLFKPSQLS